jgi:GAF domain-containing protein
MSTTTESPLIVADIVKAVVQADEPEYAAERLLGGCAQLVGADRGRLYLYDLETADYRSVAHTNRSDSASIVRAPASPEDLKKPIERAISTLKPQILRSPSSVTTDSGANKVYQSRVVLPIVRKSTCLGILDLDAARTDAFPEYRRLIARLEIPLQLAATVYNRRFRLRLLEEAQRPVDFNVPEREFFDDIMILTAVAGQVEFAILRELEEDGALRCRGVHNLGDPEQLDEFTLDEPVNFPPFYEVITTREAYVARDMEGPDFATLRAIDVLKPIQSFVAVPVLVGTDIYGTLSFSSSRPYDYTRDEVAGFKNIANGIGVSIANYRNFHRAAENVARFTDAATAITGIEVAQAARHEARGYIDNCVANLLLLKGANRNPACDVYIDRINGNVNKTMEAMEKIKVATRPPAKDRRRVTLRSIWEEARSQLIGRLSAARVEAVEYQGPDVELEVPPDWFRQVFINLILNSTDAFLSSSKRRGHRSIRLIVEKVPDRSAYAEMSYIDNAGGINPAALKTVDGAAIDVSVEQAIFEPYVTSRDAGSGYGLTLVRKILTDEGGSIDLVQYRQNVVFRIQVPRARELKS